MPPLARGEREQMRCTMHDHRRCTMPFATRLRSRVQALRAAGGGSVRKVSDFKLESKFTGLSV